MIKHIKIYEEYIMTYGAWLLLVTLWNFGYSQATPFQDVLAAVALAFFTNFTLRKLKVLKGL